MAKKSAKFKPAASGAPPVDTGIDAKDRAKIAAGLSRLLADTYTVYLKTHNFHWNVTGPMFNTLHLMFETQYTELAAAVDLIAERIRALGHPAPGSYKACARLSSIQEEEGLPSAEEMIRQLRANPALSRMDIMVVSAIGRDEIIARGLPPPELPRVWPFQEQPLAACAAEA